MAGEDDEQDVRQLHLQHPVHCGASLRPQHKVNEHGDKIVLLWLLSILCCFKVFAANDITSIFIVLPLVFFFNRKNKAFWTGIGQVTIAIAGLLPLLAFLAIPKVEQEQAFQLLEYQWREGRFDTLGKLGSAHRAVGQHP